MKHQHGPKELTSKSIPIPPHEYNRTKVLGNPDYIGPGVWYMIHKKAKDAGLSPVPYQAKKEFKQMMEELSRTFPCLKCRTHIGEYLAGNPMEPFWTIKHEATGIDVGLFKWSVIFHDTVNARLMHWGHNDKKQMGFEAAFELYYGEDSATCNSDCGH